MTAYRSSLMRLLDARGYIHQVTDAAALDALAFERAAQLGVGEETIDAEQGHGGCLGQLADEAIAHVEIGLFGRMGQAPVGFGPIPLFEHG